MQGSVPRHKEEGERAKGGKERGETLSFGWYCVVSELVTIQNYVSLPVSVSVTRPKKKIASITIYPIAKQRLSVLVTIQN